MTIDELRDIAHTLGHACARFRLNRHAAEVGNDAACKELYTELERLYWTELTAWADQTGVLGAASPPGESRTVTSTRRPARNDLQTSGPSQLRAPLQAAAAPEARRPRAGVLACPA